jgi:exosortase
MIYGWNGVVWSWPSVALLALLFPMPPVLRAATVEPLQNIATQSRTYLLQTLGLPASCEGTTISLGETGPLNVAEACSGLSMATIFLALSVMIAAFMERPLWERIALVMGSIPIALSVNVLRITLTALIKYAVGEGCQFLGMSITKEFVDGKVHDWAGLLMMPGAMLLLWLELKLLTRIFIDADDSALTATEFVLPRSERETVPAGR